MDSTTLILHKTETNSTYIKEFLLYLKSDKGCRPKTIHVYEQDLKEFINYFINREILTLKESDIRNFKYHLVDRNLAPRTVNRKLAVLRSFYRYFVNSEEWDNIVRNPVNNVASLKIKRDTPIILNESQAETLLDGILLIGTYATRDYAIFSTFLFTGMRVDELIHLRISDIDNDNNLITIRDGKGGKSRIVPMIPRLKLALALYLQRGITYKTKGRRRKRIDLTKCGRQYFVNPGIENDNYLFLSRRGEKFTSKGIDYLFKQYVKKLGLYKEGLSLHALRRSCLTFLYKEGVDLFIIREISGHARLQTLEHYLRIDKAKVYDAMKKHPLAKTGVNLDLVDMIRGSK
ncbi:tyrosine-type recombinase/integrase [Peptococcaceae bacterium 1198_IL3148]